MAANNQGFDLRLDRPLQAGTALDKDALGRRACANRIALVLERVSAEAGLVVSIEGAWGCGKTSLLAMVEEILGATYFVQRPVVVHFNPWLIGDREALLRQFLASIAKAVKLTDQAKEGKRVARELKTYSKAFDVLKLIPGAEPWASIVKSVVETFGDASEAFFDYKTPDIEARKQAVEQALRKFPRRIVVLVDDLDRLYPTEVYEMIRIIKAVGDLPNVGYVLAWDEKFVSAALAKLNVPFAEAYLDKVVQVRMPVPPISFAQRSELLETALARLPEEARKNYFTPDTSRLALMFHHGLSDLMEHPRDVVRLFDVLMSIEPDLRGEVLLADLIGLAAIMTKAPSVFSLLNRTPQAFVGSRPGVKVQLRKPEDVLNTHAEERDAAIAACGNPVAVRELLEFLFPKLSSTDEKFSLNRAVFIEGHLGHPDRVSVALQLCTGVGDVSLVMIRRYLFRPAERASIAAGLDTENCIPFLERLSTLLGALGEDVVLDVEPLAIALARIIETQPFVSRARTRADVFFLPPEAIACGAIAQVSKRLAPEEAALLAEKLIADPEALSVAVEVAVTSYIEDRQDGSLRYESVLASKQSKDRVTSQFAENVERAADAGELFNKGNPGRILWVLPVLAPSRCKAVFDAIRQQDPNLDDFAKFLLGGGFDSTKGQYFETPKQFDRFERYIPLSELRTHAEARLADEDLRYPVRAAWRALLEEKSLYGKDGSEA